MYKRDINNLYNFILLTTNVKPASGDNLILYVNRYVTVINVNSCSKGTNKFSFHCHSEEDRKFYYELLNHLIHPKK